MKKNASEYEIPNTYDRLWTEYYEEYAGGAYPLYVYYLNLRQMVMGGSHFHWHSEIEMNFVRSGSAVITISGVKKILNAGEAIFINEGRVHSIELCPDSKDCVIISVLFNSSYLFDNEASFLSLKYKNTITADSKLSFIHFENSSPEDHKCIELIEAILKTNLEKKFGFELMTKSLLCNFWMELINKSFDLSPDKNQLSPSDELRVKCAVSYIHQNYMNPLTLDEIAECIHVSKSECCRCFKRAANMTPFEYLMQERILQSARKMQRGDADSIPVNELARLVGFNNSSYYNKIFRKYMNTTPSGYKNIIKKSHRDSLSPFGISLSRM